MDGVGLVAHEAGAPWFTAGTYDRRRAASLRGVWVVRHRSFFTSPYYSYTHVRL